MLRARIIMTLLISLSCVFSTGMLCAQSPSESQADPKLLELLNKVEKEYTAEEIDELRREENPFYDFIGDDEAEDSIEYYTKLSFIKPGKLPRVAFMPMVFDKVLYLDSFNVVDKSLILAGDIPETDWLKRVAESNRRYRSLKQWYVIAYPERVRYNINTLPVPPKTYKATVDPSTSKITLNEVIVNVAESDLKSGVAPVEVIQKHWLHVLNASAQFSAGICQSQLVSRRRQQYQCDCQS